MIENPLLDRAGGNPNKTHTIGFETLKIVKNKLNLIDIWGKNHPFQKSFTYHNGDNTTHSRLHRFYITKTIKTTKCQIIPTTISDQDILVNKTEPKGRGIWKLNTSTLTHKTFQNIFKQFCKDSQNEKTKYKTHRELQEIGKLYIKTITTEYRTKKNKEKNNRYNRLIPDINKEKLKPHPDYKKIEQNQIELEDIHNYKTDGNIIRSQKIYIYIF